MSKLADYLTSQQLSRSERVGDYLTSQQLSRSERVGDYLTSQQLSRSERVGNYLTMQEMQGAYRQMNGMGDLTSAMGWVKDNMWLSLGAVAAAGYFFRKDIKKLF